MPLVLAGGGIPELDAVGESRDEHGTRRIEAADPPRHGPSRPSQTRGGRNIRRLIADRPAKAAPSVPDADRAIVAPGRDEPLARPELDGPDGPVVAVRLGAELRQGHIPGLNDLLDGSVRRLGATPSLIPGKA